jgi:hypothetical protein
MNDINKIIRIKTVGDINEVEGTTVSYIGMEKEEVEETDNSIDLNDPWKNTLSRQIDNAPMTTISMNVFTKEIKDVDIKNSKTVYGIIPDIINYYCSIIDDDQIRIIDKNTENKSNLDRKLLSNVMNGTNIIARNSRRGPGNCIIIPKHIYENDSYNTYLKTLLNMYIFINTTDVHTDKIIVVRVESKLSEPTAILFTDTNLSQRALKLRMIRNKLNQENLDINYIIDHYGDFKDNIQILQLKNFD